MKVFVVTGSINWEFTDILAIYKKEDRAKRCVELLKKHDKYYDDYEYQECVLDEDPDRSMLKMTKKKFAECFPLAAAMV